MKKNESKHRKQNLKKVLGKINFGNHFLTSKSKGSKMTKAAFHLRFG